jgi:hypothetical protein
MRLERAQSLRGRGIDFAIGREYCSVTQLLQVPSEEFPPPRSYLPPRLPNQPSTRTPSTGSQNWLAIFELYDHYLVRIGPAIVRRKRLGTYSHSRAPTPQKMSVVVFAVSRLHMRTADPFPYTDRIVVAPHCISSSVVAVRTRFEGIGPRIPHTFSLLPPISTCAHCFGRELTTIYILQSRPRSARLHFKLQGILTSSRPFFWLLWSGASSVDKHAAS